MSIDINQFPLWTAIVTPLTDDGAVDYEALERLLRLQEAAQNGVVILGSTGEALNLDHDEKIKILDLALGLKLKIPLMAGVGGINLNETSEWVRYLNKLPLDAYMLVTPIYAKPGAEGQFQWFKALMDIAMKPVVVYNVPGRTAVALNHESLKRLASHPRMWGVKEASGNIVDFKRYREAAPNARFFSGDDALTPLFCANGAKGLISVASNVWPEATHEYVRQSLKKSLEETELWKECSDSLFIASNPVPVKCLLYHLGLIKSPRMKPPLDHRDLKSLAPLTQAHASITEWYRAQNKE